MKLAGLMAFIVFTFSSLASIGQCNYTLQLDDTFGDGWNGNTIDVYVAGTTTNYTLSDPPGNTTTINLLVNTGDSISLNYLAGGSYNSEVSFTLFDASGAQLYASGTGPVTGVHYELTAATCPACLPATSPMSSNLTSSSADLGWTENNGATEWQIEYGASGFSQGSGTLMIASSNPTTLSGLSGFTAYDWYVRSICGAGDTSGWTSVSSFTTSFVCPAGAVCATYSSGNISTDDSFTSLPGFSACFGELSVVIPSGNRVDSVNTFYDMSAVGSGWMAEQRSYLYSPTTLSGESTLAAGAGNTTGTINYSRNGLTFANGAVDTVKIQMHAGRTYAGTAGCNDVVNRVDDGTWTIVVYYGLIPPCVEPNTLSTSNLTSSSVDLDWNEVGTATSWQVSYGTSGFTAGIGTQQIVSSKPHSVSGLSANTAYDWFVRSICGAGDTSSWSAVNSFTTPCAPDVAPITESFDVTTIPNCWSQSATSGGPWSFNPTFFNSVTCSAASDHTGNGGYYAGVDMSGTDAGVILEMNAVDVSGLTTPYLEFYYWMCDQGYTPLNILNVEYYDGTSWNLVSAIQSGTNGSWDEFGFVVSSYVYNTNLVKFRFRAESGGSGSDFYGDHGLDDISIKEAPSCPNPTNLMTTNVTADSATFSWTDANGAGSYLVELGLSGFTLGSGSLQAVSADSVIFTALTSNTNYDAYVRVICGAGDTSDWVGPTSFLTLCTPYTSTYSQNFDGTADPNIDACWTVINTTGSASAWIRTENDGNDPQRSSPNSIEFYNTSFTTGDLILVSPEFSDLDNTKRVSFYYQDEGSTAYLSDLIFGTLSDPNNAATFTPLDTILESQMSATWEEFIYSFENYVGTDKYVGIKHGMNTTFDYLFIDDFLYEDIPDCNNPSAFTTDTVGTDIVTVSWTAGGTETKWNIEYGLDGFTQGSGTTIAEVTNPYTITGLSAATAYDIYVQAICGEGKSATLSPWTGPLSVSTSLQGPVGVSCVTGTPSVVFTDDLESLNGWTGNIGTAVNNWIYRTGGTPSSGTGPTGAHSGSQYVFVETSGASVGTDVSFVSPQINLSAGLNSAELSFWMHAVGAQIGTLEVGVGSSAAGPFTNLFSYSGQVQSAQADPFFNVGVNLDAYVGQTIYIEFNYVTNGSYAGDIALDLIEVTTCANCPSPASLATSNLAATSADFGWVAGGSETEWEVSYGASGFTAGSGTQAVVSSTSYSASSLTAETSYDWYVRAICGAGDTSGYSGPVSFTTPCAAQVAPYTESFDATTIPNCWSQSATSGGPWVFGAPGIGWNTSGCATTPTDNTGNGGNFATLDHSSTDVGVILEMADVDVSALTNSYFSFYFFMCGTGYTPINILYVEAWDGSSWVGVDTIQEHTNGWKQYAYEMNAFIYNTNLLRIRFRAESGGSGSDFYGDNAIDDIAIVEKPNCLDPTAMSASSITSSSADLAWTDNNGATSWQIEYGASGFTQGTGTVVMVGTNPYTLGSLTDNTAYDWYVRSICGAGDTSAYAGPGTFATACNPYSTPYFEGFETGYTNNADVDGCITQESVTGGNNWTANNTNTTYNRTPRTGAWNAFLRYSNEDWLFIPITLTGGTSYTAEVYARQDGSTTTNADVTIAYGSSNSAAAMTNTVAPATGIDANYQLIGGQFTPGSSGTYYIGIKGYMNGSPWYISIDDIAVYETPSCIAPTSLMSSSVTDNSASISWTENNSATEWEVEYGTSGFSQGSGMTMITTNNPASLTGLTAQTTYDWYVRSICGAGDTSTWAGPSSFTTLCSAVSLPYTESFENSGSIPACWTQGSANSEDWRFGSGSAATYGPTSGYGGSGYYAWIDDSSPHNTNTSLETPLIDLTGAMHPGLEFYLWSENHGNTTTFLLHIEADTGSGFHNVTTLDVENTGWELQRVYLGDYAGTNVQLRFVGEEVGTGYQKDIAIDEVMLKDGFNCERPENLRAQYLSDTSAVLVWNTIPNSTYKIRLKVAGTSTWGPPIFRQTNVGRIVVKGLTPSTKYVFLVRANCKGGWGIERTAKFQTLAAPCYVPTGLMANKIHHNKAKLNWHAMPGAIKYRVRYRPSGGSWTTVPVDGSRTNRWIAGLASSTTYEWQAKTVCEFGTSTSGTVWSPVKMFTTLPPLAPSVRLKGEDVSMTAEYEIYPNPTTENITLNYQGFNNENVIIRLNDISGRVLREFKLNNATQQNQFEIELNDLSSGIYFVDIFDGNDKYVEKVIKH